MDTIKPKNKISLYKALRVGYSRDLPQQKRALKKYGYVVDTALSQERERIVAFNPTSHKLLFIEQGTDPRSLKDLATDAVLATGKLKETSRYKEDHNALLKARKKYDVPADKVNVVGHSLGGAITNYITPSVGHGYTYNTAFIPNQKARPNIHNFRTEGDIISAFAPKQTTTVLPNPNPDTINPKSYLLKAHQLENIKHENIYF